MQGSGLFNLILKVSEIHLIFVSRASLKVNLGGSFIASQCKCIIMITLNAVYITNKSSIVLA